MRFATAHTVALDGSVGHVVDVQVDLGQGLVGTTLVGRPDSSISEARDRCRAAVDNSGYQWPTHHRVTILLSPADLPKRGPHFDLAIAAAVLVAGDDDIAPDALDGIVFIGELGLDGGLRPATGVLPMVMAAASYGLTRAVVPEPQAAEAALVPGMQVVGVRSLRQAMAVITGKEIPDAAPVPRPAGSSLLHWRGHDRLDEVDLADLVGMPEERFALEVAAAGGHHLLLSGPKGAGKTTLAERLPGLLPDLDLEDALEVSALHSLAGCLLPETGLIRRPPYSAPHHSATAASVIGGGSGRVRPGEISKAHHGVLFLDEFAHFRADIVDGLREPLESGEIRVARGEETAVFPARALVVLASNPCPCGDYHPLHRDHRCQCGEARRRNYRNKLSGPVADRIDIVRHVEPRRQWEARDPLACRESTAVVRARVAAARQRQRERYAGTPWRVNGEVPGAALRQRWPLPDAAQQALEACIYDGRLSSRGVVRVHRLAHTLADLRGVPRPTAVDVDVALALRTGHPLPGEVFRRTSA